jgi:hypothetical protein
MHGHPGNVIEGALLPSLPGTSPLLCGKDPLGGRAMRACGALA